MNNEEIIFKGIQKHLGITDEEASALLQSGKFPVYHTYEYWKSLGYQVKKGEHAEVKLSIWKQGKERQTEDGVTVPAKMFMKTASFFGAAQVEKIVIA